VGAAAWAAQYQQDPELQGGGIFNPLWFGPQVEINEDQIPHLASTAQSWDLTFKGTEDSDWVAGGSWAYHQGLFYLRTAPFFARADFVDTLNQINARIRAPGWAASAILIEAKANGPAVDAVIRKELPGLIHMVEPDGSKVARSNAVTPILSSGRIRIVRGPHLERWRQTFPRFPALKRDDEIDQMTQALRWLGDRGGYWDALRAISAR
jgi:predicted phage terminase large subunit-like protein